MISILSLRLTLSSEGERQAKHNVSLPTGHGSSFRIRRLELQRTHQFTLGLSSFHIHNIAPSFNNFVLIRLWSLSRWNLSKWMDLKGKSSKKLWSLITVMLFHTIVCSFEVKFKEADGSTLPKGSNIVLLPCCFIRLCARLRWNLSKRIDSYKFATSGLLLVLLNIGNVRNVHKLTVPVEESLEMCYLDCGVVLYHRLTRMSHWDHVLGCYVTLWMIFQQ